MREKAKREHEVGEAARRERSFRKATRREKHWHAARGVDCRENKSRGEEQICEKIDGIMDLNIESGITTRLGMTSIRKTHKNKKSRDRSKT